MSLFDLKGKVAIVTGGNRGLGKAMALELARSGATIALVDIKVSNETLADFEKEGLKATGYDFNLTHFDEYSSLVAKILKDQGSIDILVNNAGVKKSHPAVEYPKNDWDFVMDINATAVFYMCQTVGKIMIEKGYGKIINMASLLSFQGGTTVPSYAASKGAVMQFSKSLSNEWASKGVNVNCIAPGNFNTEMSADFIHNPKILERTPAGRWGEPEDLAGTAVYLASKASDYVNGHTLVVDGGILGR